jgi:hypothetical protein
MSENTTDSETISKPTPPATPKGARKGGKKAKPAKKAGRAKKAAGKPKADPTNKKAEVIEMMRRAKGATLPEIMKATGWQSHTVRGFVSILGSKGGEKIVSSKRRGRNRSSCCCQAGYLAMMRPDESQSAMAALQTSNSVSSDSLSQFPS